MRIARAPTNSITVIPYPPRWASPCIGTDSAGHGPLPRLAVEISITHWLYLPTTTAGKGDIRRARRSIRKNSSRHSVGSALSEKPVRWSFLLLRRRRGAPPLATNGSDEGPLCRRRAQADKQASTIHGIV